jgi:nucleoside-diphosphate-sugar epimerase
MADTVFVTGFPGFLGSELVRRILRRGDGARVVCLVQPKFLDLARTRAAELAAAAHVPVGRVELLPGDITRAGLGLAEPEALAEGVTEVFHLAAVYDLSVRREVGMKVNVEGTRNLLDFARSAPRLGRFQYVSTCYVSGRYTGIFRETDLEKGQPFNNFYEETKYLAEIEVRRALADGLPATIYRPAIVVGDSQTGETQKYDGPYFILRWLLKQPTVAVLPVPGDPHMTRGNFVPRDFVIDSIAALATDPRAVGKCYQLADPDPPTADALIKMFSEATGRIVVRVPTPVRLAKAAIDHVPGVFRLLEIPSDAIDYFVHPTFYDTTQATADLARHGIHCPRFHDYLPALVAFMKRHPEIGSEAMA